MREELEELFSLTGVSGAPVLGQALDLEMSKRTQACGQVASCWTGRSCFDSSWDEKYGEGRKKGRVLTTGSHLPGLGSTLLSLGPVGSQLQLKLVPWPQYTPSLQLAHLLPSESSPRRPPLLHTRPLARTGGSARPVLHLPSFSGQSAASSTDAPLVESEVPLLSRGCEKWLLQGLDFWDSCTSRLSSQTLSSAHGDPALCAPLSGTS